MVYFLSFSMKDHKVRIHTGYGIEPILPDVTCKHLLRDILVPRFKEKQYYTGINDLITNIQKTIDKSIEDLNKMKLDIQKQKDKEYQQNKQIIKWSIIILFLLILLVTLIYYIYKYYDRYKKLKEEFLYTKDLLNRKIVLIDDILLHNTEKEFKYCEETILLTKIILNQNIKYSKKHFNQIYPILNDIVKIEDNLLQLVLYKRYINKTFFNCLNLLDINIEKYNNEQFTEFKHSIELYKQELGDLSLIINPSTKNIIYKYEQKIYKLISEINKFIQYENILDNIQKEYNEIDKKQTTIKVLMLELGKYNYNVHFNSNIDQIYQSLLQNRDYNELEKFQVESNSIINKLNELLSYS